MKLFKNLLLGAGLALATGTALSAQELGQLTIVLKQVLQSLVSQPSVFTIMVTRVSISPASVLGGVS